LNKLLKLWKDLAKTIGTGDLTIRVLFLALYQSRYSASMAHKFSR